MSLFRRIASLGMLAQFVLVSISGWAFGGEAIAEKPLINTVSDCPAGLSPNDKPGYLKLAGCLAKKQGLPEEVAHAVMEIESNFQPSVIGGDGEVGLMQILPSTAKLLGFSGTNDDLAKPETNLRYGVRYLSQAWKLAKQDLCTTVMKYRAGHGETRFSYLSVNYCVRARAILQREGFEVSGEVPTATFGFANGSVFAGSKGGTCLRRSFVPGPGYGRCLAASGKVSQARAVALRRGLFGG